MSKEILAHKKRNSQAKNVIEVCEELHNQRREDGVIPSRLFVFRGLEFRT